MNTFPITPRRPAFGWRITKYDPRFRDHRGCYLRDEWIGPGQIGGSFVDGVLTQHEYLRVESLYASAALDMWRAFGAPPLQIQSLEGATSFGLPPQSDDFDDVGFGDWRPINGEELPGDRLEAMVRWCLRDFGWCIIVGDAFYLHFGYDFYMYIGASDTLEEPRARIEASGLFVEPCSSPHDELPSMRFGIDIAERTGGQGIIRQIELSDLPPEAIAEVWPPIRSLVGYTSRKIDADLAATIARYADVTFDLDAFSYWLDSNR